MQTMTTRETDALIARHVGPHPATPGLDEYWLVDPGIPVWAIIGAYKAARGNAGTRTTWPPSTNSRANRSMRPSPTMIGIAK